MKPAIIRDVLDDAFRDQAQFGVLAKDMLLGQFPSRPDLAIHHRQPIGYAC